MPKISYNTQINDPKTGTYYTQRLSLTYSELLHLKLAIESEIALGYPRIREYNNGDLNGAKLYLTRIKVLSDNNRVYLNLTQGRFIKMFLLEKDKKRFLGRNTFLEVKKINKKSA